MARCRCSASNKKKNAGQSSDDLDWGSGRNMFSMAAFRGVFHVADHGVMAPRAPSKEHAISNWVTLRPWKAVPYSINLIQLLKTIGCAMLYSLSALSSSKRSRKMSFGIFWKLGPVKKLVYGANSTHRQFTSVIWLRFDFCRMILDPESQKNP